ncbi:MAG: 3-phosphoshikimate 1-carboxyvinyltransferase [bacterium]
MRIEIIPNKLSGSIDVIPSKSCLHRAIIASSLADGISTIENILFSDDIKATINACIKLGASIEKKDNKLIIKGTTNYNTNQIVDCIESGSTLRFMIPIFLINNNKVKFIGSEGLLSRPLDVYYNIFDKQNIKYNNLLIEGNLKPDTFYIDGSISSQFITGLLFSLPLLKNDSKIVITNNLESKGYVDITIDILKKFNIIIENNNYNEFIIKGNQKYISANYQTEADYSQASFFLVANELGSNISINNLNINSLQPDKKIIDDILKIKNNKKIDLSENPDCGPILSVLASFYNTSFINAKRLRIKECDRITSMVNNLNLLNANVVEEEDKMHFDKVSILNGNEVNSYNDHRVAMAMAIASTVCSSNVILNEANSVSKSYPKFWDDFKKLGGKFNVK